MSNRLKIERGQLQAVCDHLSLSQSELLEAAQQPESPRMREAQEVAKRFLMVRVRELERKLMLDGAMALERERHREVMQKIAAEEAALAEELRMKER